MCGLLPKIQPLEKQISTYVVKSGKKNGGQLTSKHYYAGVAELAQALVLGTKICGFESHHLYHLCPKPKSRSRGKMRGRTQDAWHKRSNILQAADIEHCVKTRLQSCTKDSKPMVIEVLYTDLLFQLPLTITRSRGLSRYVACGERPLKTK